MSSYQVSPEARADLDQIESYIARDSVEAAERWIGRLFETFRLLSRNPGLGHVRRDITPSALLFWPVQAYVVVYRPWRDGIQIVAVTQGSREMLGLLRKRAL